MPQLLTPEWLKWLGERLSDHEVDPDIDLVLQHRVVEQDNREFCWHIRFENGSVSVAEGLFHANETHDRTVTFISDPETVAEVITQTTSVQQAVLQGRIRITGNPMLLTAALPGLKQLALAAAPS